MTNGNAYPNNGRSMAEVLNEFKEELKDFATTRIQMLRSELNDKIGAWKMGAPVLIVGLVLMWLSLMLITACMVCVIALAFGGQMWAYAASFAIVFVIFLAAGAMCVAYGIRKIKAGGLAPERTMRVLNQDKVWLQTEARTQV